MSKLKKTGKTRYEILFIVSNKYSENELPPILEKIENLITSKGGEIVFREVWGKKKLAYTIKHFTHGYYFYFEFTAERNIISELDKSLRMQNEPLRHVIALNVIKAEDKPKKPIIREERKVDESKDEPEVKIETESDEEKAKKAAKEAKKMDLKDLDEKLDKILDVDSLL